MSNRSKIQSQTAAKPAKTSAKKAKAAVESAEAPAPPSFPLRVACVDTGSNAIRFLVAEFQDRDRFTLLDAERVPVRLGHEVFLTGRLSDAASDAALAAFGDFRRRLDVQGNPVYRAVATSAVRESANGDDFLRRVRKEAGIDLEVITGTEEARLVHLAIRRRVTLGRDRWVLVDLGGGSVEVSLVDDSGILWSESHNMGSVRLLEELSGAEDDPGRFHRVLEEYVSTLRLPPAARYRQPSGFIATGGNIEALAQLAGAVPDASGVSRVPVADLRAVIETLARFPYRRRVEELGLREDRADVILPAALVYEQLAELAGSDRVLVPHVGIKEGLLLDLVDTVTSQEDREERRERETYDGALTLGRRYMFDEDHAVHVARLARSLFDQLRRALDLPVADRKILLAAALLHDIGSYISYKKHHRHSHYLISHSELPGLSPREIELVAAVARYHRKSDPNPEHDFFARLSGEDRVRVTRLASLLRVADAFDREHRQVVSGVRVRVSDKEVLVEPDAQGDILLERWFLKKRAQLFGKTFGRTLRVRGV